MILYASQVTVDVELSYNIARIKRQVSDTALVTQETAITVVKPYVMINL
jgi:hypothetical protein